MENQVTLTMQDQQELEVLQLLDAAKVTAREAGELLDCTERHVYRKLAAFRSRGVAAVPHGNRGRRPHNALDQQRRQEAIKLISSDEYKPVNNHHLAELLAENEGLHFSVSTVRRLRLQAGKRSPRKRRSPKGRQARERKAQVGMMLQIDSSKHQWFGPDGGYCALHWAVDDATSTICGAVFRAQEDCAGYLTMLEQVIERHGVPMSLYADRHAIFRPSTADKLTVKQQLKGQQEPVSQFGRAVAQLGIQQITAYSPQAKGRVERSFQTAQDRLVNEMRIAGVTTIQQANAFLPRFIERYNERFGKPPADPEPVWRPAPLEADLKAALCLRYERVADNTNTVSFGNRRLTVAGPERTYARRTIEIRVALDGQFTFHYDDRLIGEGPRVEGDLRTDPSELARSMPQHPPATAKPPEAPKRKARREPITVTPAPNHPWKKPAIVQRRRS